MKELIHLSSETGETITFEVVTSDPESGMDTASRSSNTASQPIELALASIKPAVEAVLGKLTQLTERPQVIEVEFGLKVSAQTGVIIASGTLESNFVVKLKWTRETNAGE